MSWKEEQNSKYTMLNTSPIHHTHQLTSSDSSFSSAAASSAGASPEAAAAAPEEAATGPEETEASLEEPSAIAYQQSISMLYTFTNENI